MTLDKFDHTCTCRARFGRSSCLRVWLLYITCREPNGGKMYVRMYACMYMRLCVHTAVQTV